ncbi:CBO0543 family protein [Desertibacillus haloalkaliphilus]|uniref:CBO0543 family protein n=1 Tax=Desertibacillus haloalkaliphilus TaxID=1328930 RepID=UPI0028AAC4DD|nr:CBO0543 family protein [Desertibacillus haloalkaliphilus]
MMKRNKIDKGILGSLLAFGFVLLPIMLRKPPIKDWLLVFLWNAVTNGIIDKVVVSYNTVKYPVRLLPKMFKTNILFDFLLYPVVTIIYNQLTEKDKPLVIFLKLFYFTIPMILIELYAERKTGLIKFKRGWRWYHSFISLNIKSLLTRLWIGWVRKLAERQ